MGGNLLHWLFTSTAWFGFAVTTTQAAGKLVYFGSATEKTSEGIYVAHFDPATGVLSPPILAAKTTNPLFINFHPNRRVLYAWTGKEPVHGGAVE